MSSTQRLVEIPAGPIRLFADLVVPESAVGLVAFAHGSGSSRRSTRNRSVAQSLQESGLATLLMDLLTEEEEAVDRRTAHLRFDIGLLAGRLVNATDWIVEQSDLARFSLGYFGASTGAAAALMAAAQRPQIVRAVVSRGGRPDLAASALASVRAPTLLIVGGNDVPVIGMNRDAMRQMTCDVHLEVVPGASHLFEEPGALVTVADLAGKWLLKHLKENNGPM